MNTVDIKAKTAIYRGICGEDGIARFYGVRYAKKPERWRVAEPLEASEELVEAYEPGDACVQPVFPSEWPLGEPPMSEDCLWLNIWSANKETKGRPVMVWIHGGSYMSGSARFEYMNGGYGDFNRIAATNPDIVFVSINYRLNFFGSIDLSAFDGHEGYEDSNDLALHDMLEALKWIHENISFFGGDPDNVTLMGQSAGGHAVFSLCVIPQAARYFQKAIPSSSGFSEYNDFKDAPRSAAGSEAIKNLLGVSTVEELLNVPAEKFAENAFRFLMESGSNFDFINNGRLFPEHPFRAWSTGVAKHISILTGSTSGELETMIFGWPDEEIKAVVPTMLGRDEEMNQKAAEKFVENYPERDEITAYKDALNDIGIRGRVMVNVEEHIKAGGKAYVWYCDYISKDSLLRTQHCFDSVYVFDALDSGASMGEEIPEPIATFSPSKTLQKKMEKAWMEFVRSGDPNCSEIGAEWKPYDTENKWTMHINDKWALVQGGIRPKDLEVTLQMHSEEGLK